MIVLPNLSPRSSFESSARRRAIIDLTLEEMVIWAYRDQRVEQMTASSLDDLEWAADEARQRGIAFSDAAAMLSSGMDSVARVQRIAELGTEIDGGGQSFSCHPDAELLHDEVCVVARTWKGDGSRIKRFGKSGEMPDWRTEEPKPKFIPVDEKQRGKYRHKIETAWCAWTGAKPRIARGEFADLEQIGEHVWHIGFRFCPIAYYPPPEYVERMRQDYADWHRAMTRLMDRVARVAFGDYRVIGFGAPAEPWNG